MGPEEELLTCEKVFREYQRSYKTRKFLDFSTFFASGGPVFEVLDLNVNGSGAALVDVYLRVLRIRIRCCRTVCQILPTFLNAPLTAEIVDFVNPDRPEDKTWDPHDNDYPRCELEFPNTNATERYILLAPKDKEHYSPMLCLERALHAMIECMSFPRPHILT